MKKNLTIILFANIINMLLSVAIGFMLPKYLSIDSYGYYKIFQFYLNYIGLLHLGYADGIYLQYGGMDLTQIDKNRILINSATLRNLQLILSIIFLISGIYISNIIMIFLAISLVPVNMITFYKNIFQATGEFKKYGYIISLLPMISFLCYFILLIIIKTDNYVYYILITIMSNLFMYFMLEIGSLKLFGNFKLWVLDFKDLIFNIKNGFTLLLGNFTSVLIVGIDRWFIQIFLTLKDFSYYSFAVSIENLFNICVSAVTITFYNYLCKEKDAFNIRRMKTCCIIMGIYMIAIAFPVKFIIQIWLVKYENSITCLFYLIAAHAFYFVIKAIYVNMYKANHEQKYYFFQMLYILIIAVLADIFAYYFISKTKEVFAIATLFTAMIWYYICFLKSRDIRSTKRENILLYFSVILFLCCGLLIQNAIVGAFLYICIVSLLVFIIYRKYEYNILGGLHDIFSK